MKRAADGTPAARDLKSYRARMGIAPCVVVKNAKDVMTSFCGTTASRVFFEYPDESQKLMHAAVVTACDGYVFFEDMDVDCYSSALKVPFKEYRSQETPHVYLHCNVPSAFDIEAKMLGAKVPCRSVLAVAKQFFGSELGIVRDACGFSWTLATKSEEAVEVQPEPAVRASLSVPDVDAYLSFLKEVFGDALVERKVSRGPDAGLEQADLLLYGSGLVLSRGEVCSSIFLQAPSGQADAMSQKLADGGPIAVKQQFCGQVAGLHLPCGIYLNIHEAMPDGPTDAAKSDG
ncbi:unnamed protein product [Effrenium voratum]|nr:unnamed protein product [Effrenium voratum]CAJ1442491.1 unnamed protein product [Effrenium voratum]